MVYLIPLLLDVAPTLGFRDVDQFYLLPPLWVGVAIFRARAVEVFLPVNHHLESYPIPYPYQ